MTAQFDDRLLDEFAHNFYGYGNSKGNFWFVGMEEGGGDSFEEVNNRLNVWAKNGKRELEDCAKFHAAIGEMRWHGYNPALQSTWNKLIRIYLASQGQEPTTDQVREYQRTSLGMMDGDTSLMELMPLPSPSKANWMYAKYSLLPYLATREKYEMHMSEHRITHLTKRIKEQKPKAVVFYSLSYDDVWREIAGVDFLEVRPSIFMGRNASSVFAITKHPVATGVTSEYYHQVGRIIGSELKRR